MNKEKEDYWNDKLKSFRVYIKKNPLKKGKKRVRQRTKKDSIIVEGSFCSIHPELKGIVLKAMARPEEWKKIESFILDHPDWFGLEFHSHFANPAVLEISEKNKPRGMQKKIYHFVNDIKIPVGILYAFFSYWCRKPLEEWPDYLQRLVEMIKKYDWFDYVFKGQRGTNRPYRLTRYCIEKAYGETINSLGLKLFDDPKNFLETYVHADRRAERFTQVFGSKSPQEVATFAYIYPVLKYIFETLEAL